MDVFMENFFYLLILFFIIGAVVATIKRILH